MASFVLPRPQFISISMSGGNAAAVESSSSICFSLAVKRSRFNQFRVSSSSSPSPWLMLPPSLDGTDLLYDFYCLGEDKVVSFKKRNESESESDMPDDETSVVGMSHGWLIRNQVDGNLFLSNPISGRHIKLPSALNLPVENVMISPHDPQDQNCRALMIYGPERRLAFCCPAWSSNWTPFPNKRTYFSSVYSKQQKLFFCLTQKQGIEAWDLSRLNSPRMMFSFNDIDVRQHSTVASLSLAFEESLSLAFEDKNNGLYQVHRFTATRLASDGSHVMRINFGDLPVEEAFPYQTTYFDVYKFDTRGYVWNYMDRSLGGMAIFVGKNHGFVLSASDYQGLKSDAVYFTDIEKNPFHQDIGGGHDMGIFDYQTKKVSSCYYSSNYHRIKKILPPPLWFTPNWY